MRAKYTNTHKPVSLIGIASFVIIAFGCNSTPNKADQQIVSAGHNEKKTETAETIKKIERVDFEQHKKNKSERRKLLLNSLHEQFEKQGRDLQWAIDTRSQLNEEITKYQNVNGKLFESFFADCRGDMLCKLTFEYGSKSNARQAISDMRGGGVFSWRGDILSFSEKKSKQGKQLIYLVSSDYKWDNDKLVKRKQQKTIALPKGAII